jgi:hypothetical protein
MKPIEEKEVRAKRFEEVYPITSAIKRILHFKNPTKFNCHEKVNEPQRP